MTTDTSPTPIPIFFYSPSPSQLCLPRSLLAPLSVSSSSLSLLLHPPSSPPCILIPPSVSLLLFFPTWIADISAVFALPHGSVSLGGGEKIEIWSREVRLSLIDQHSLRCLLLAPDRCWGEKDDSPTPQEMLSRIGIQGRVQPNSLAALLL